MSIPRRLILAALLIVLPAFVGAAIIDNSARYISWQVPFAIPERTTICATLDNSTYGDGVTDAAAAINSAISGCTPGQVVYLPPGTYSVSSANLAVNKGITLRGAGAGLTTIKLGSSRRITGTGSSRSFNQTISSGYTKGSTELTLASVSGLSVGDYIAITETKDTDGSEHGWPVDDKGCSWCGNNNGDYLMAQIVRVNNIAGNVVTISRPLYVSYDADLTPRAVGVIANTSALVNAGIENMTVDGSAAGTSGWLIYFQRAVNCWFTGLEITKIGQYGIHLRYSYGNIVRGNTIHHGYTEAASSYGSGKAYGFQLMMWNSDHLVENNTLYHLRHMLSYEGGGSGTIYAYNYMFDSFDDSNSSGWPSNPTQTWLMGQLQTHGAHPHMNLWEGNQFQHLMQDYTWGSDSHNTTFRSEITGTGPASTYNRVPIEIKTKNWYANVVGSVLGYPEMSGNYSVSGSGTGIYHLGYSNDGGSSGYDSGVVGTLYRHGNFDYVNYETVWNSGNADHDIPNSLYLSEAPAWWCSETPWPPIGPDLSPMVSDVPAKRIYNDQPCTQGPDATPAPFSFGADVTGAALNTLTEAPSDATMMGFDAGQTPAITISGTGCQYQIGAGDWTSGAGTVALGDVVGLRTTSSGSYSDPVPCSVVVGGVSGSWSVVTTQAPLAGGGSAIFTGPEASGGIEFR